MVTRPGPMRVPAETLFVACGLPGARCPVSVRSNQDTFVLLRSGHRPSSSKLFRLRARSPKTFTATTDTDRISLWMRSVRHRPASRTRTRFTPIEIDEEQVFRAGVDPEYECVTTAAVPPAQQGRVSDQHREQVSLLSLLHDSVPAGVVHHTHTRRRTSRCSDYLRGYLGNQSILSSSGGCFVQCTQSAYTSVRMQHADAFRHRYMTPCCCRQWHRLCGAKERTSTPPSSVRRKRESSTRRAVCLKPLVRGVLLEHTGCTRAPSMRACDRHKNRFRTDPVDECTTTYKYHELGFSLIQFEKKKSMKQRSMHGMVYGTPNERQLATASKFGDLAEPETETNARDGVRDAERTSAGDSVKVR
jgi:hypothetical protein